MRTHCTMRNRVALVVVTSVLFAACGSTHHTTARADTTCDGKIAGKQSIVAWFHIGSLDPEGVELKKQTDAFNASQSDVHVRVVFIPNATYTQTVQNAAASGALPDVLDFDGPNLYSYAWRGLLKPLDSCIPPKLEADLLPSLQQQGSYARQTWGIGSYDSGLGLYVRPSILRKIGARIPNGVDDPWTASEFTDILQRLRAAGYRQPLDMKMNYATPKDAAPEWFTYGFSPIVWSAGGDLIDRKTYRTAEGSINSAASVRALTTLQGWFRDGLVNPDSHDDAFVRGQSPISWVGHWEYTPYHQAFPNDLQIVPLPRFGPTLSSGMGSWQWGITSNAVDGDAAWRYIAFLMRPDQIRAMTEVNGAVPGTNTAIGISANFAPGGPEHIYVTQLQRGIGRPRPQTPAYPAITAAFASAFLKITQGHDVKQALDVAARQVDANLAANGYYTTSGS